MEPYNDLSPVDSKWLYDHHQTKLGALSWLEDEIHFQDGGFQIWLTSEGTFEMEDKSISPRKTFKIKGKKAISMVKKMGGKKAAIELIAQAREKTGGTPTPGVEMFAQGLTEDVQIAQGLRYPKLYPRSVNYAIGQSMKFVEFDLLAQASSNTSSNIPASMTADFNQTLKSSMTHLGEHHLRTLELLELYQKHMKTPYPNYDKMVEDLDPNRLTRSSQVIETTEKMMKTAESQWNEGKKEESVSSLKNAYNLSKVHFAENHPQVLKIQALGNSVQASR